eukprot:438250_1
MMASGHSTYTSAFTERAIELLVSGYIHEQQSDIISIPNDLISLFLSFYNDVTFLTLTGASLTQFVSRKHQEKYIGPTIEIMGFEWQFIFYPNGELEDEEGYVQFYCELTKAPERLTHVIVYYAMNCVEANYECRSCHKFKRITDATAWPPLNVQLSAYKQTNSLHFGCYIDVKHVRYNPDPKDKNDDPKHYTTPMQINITNEFEWKIDDMNRLRHCECGKGMYSVNYGNDSWVLVIAPNGDNKRNKGSFIAGPKLLQLPFGVGGIGVKYTIQTNYKNIEWSDYQFFHYTQKCAQWPDDKFPTSALMDLEYLWLKITTEIMDVYDEQYEVIAKDVWSEYGIQ